MSTSAFFHRFSVAVFFVFALSLTACNKVGFIGIDTDNPKTPVSGTPSAGPAAAIQIIGPSSASVGTCQRYDLQMIDSNGLVAATFPSVTSFQVLLGAGSAQVFSDSTCATVASSFPVSVSGSAAIFLKDSVREIVGIAASTLPATFATSRNIQFVAGPPAALKLSVNPNNFTNVCVPVTIRPFDVSGNPTPIHSGISVSLSMSGLSRAALFSDAGCLSPVSFTAIPSGADSKVVYVQSLAVGNGQIAASATALTGDTANVAFVAGNAQIVLVGPTSNVISGQCVMVRAESQRTDGTALNAIGTPIDVTIAVLSGTAVQLYSDNLCLSSFANPLSIPVNFNSASFFVKTVQSPQTVTLSGAATGFASLPYNINYIPVAPTMVKVVGTPSNLPAGTCGQGQVALTDNSGAPAYVTANTSVALSAGANATQTEFFSSNNCSGAPVSSVVVPLCSGIGACVNTVGFSFRPKKVGNLVIAPASTNLLPLSASVNVTTPVGSPISLVLTRLTDPVTTDTCVKYRVETKDSFGNFIDMAADFVLNASSTSPSGLGTFYSDLNCVSSTNQITIPSGMHSQEFTFRDVRVESALLTLSGTPNPVVQDTLNIGAGAPAKLVFNGVPASVPATRCSSPITVSQKDIHDNPTLVGVLIGLTSTGGVQYFSDANCSQSMSQISIATGVNTSAPIYFAGPTAGNVTLTATGLSPASFTVPATATVNLGVAPALHVGLSCDSANLANNTCPAFEAGSCKPVYVTSFDDTNNKYIPIGGSVQVLMSTSSLNSSLFFSNANCTVALPSQSVTLTSAANPNLVYVKNTTAQNFSITGTPNTGGAGSMSLTTKPSTPFKLAITPTVGPNNFFTFQCAGPYEVKVQDFYGNLSPVGSSTPLQFLSSTLNGNGLAVGTVFSMASDCSAAPASIAANSSSAQFYMKSPLAGSLSLRAGATGLSTSDARGITIDPSVNVVMIANGTQVSSINFGSVQRGSSSLPITVTIKNLASVEAANVNPLALSGSPFERVATGSTCPTTSFSLTPNASCDVVLRFSPTAAGTFNGTFAATAVGATSGGTQTTTINLTGVGTNPVFVPIYLSASAIDFGTVNVGTTRTLNVTLTNPSAYPVSITALNVSAGFSVVVSGACGNTYPMTLAANSSCPVAVTFTPVASGLRTGNMSFNYIDPSNNSSTSTATTSLQGTGVVVSTQLALNPSGYSFTNVPVGTTSGPVNITVTNVGSVAATNLALVGDMAPFTVTMGSCGTTLNAGSSCNLNVSFTPTSVGSFSKSVNLRFDSQGGATNQTATISLTGTSVAATPTTLVISPSSYNYGSVQAGLVSSAVSFTITNTGGQAADSISLNNLGTAFQVSMGSCSGTLNPGASCQVSLWFAPSAAGSYVAYVTLQYRNAVSGTLSNIGSALVLTGSSSNALRPANLQPDVTAINFGSVAVGSQANRWTAITNTGDVTATSLSLFVSTNFTSQGFFASMGTCGSTLAPGQICYINIGLRPPYRNGYFAGAIAVKYQSDATLLKTIDIQLSGYGY